MGDWRITSYRSILMSSENAFLRHHISIAMCTFNGSRFLPEQLESIAAQCRRPDELVICDDGSSDGSVDIIKEFAIRVPFPVRIVVNRKRFGSTKNFEQAIQLCTGSLIALADQDDVWYRNKLDRIVKAFSQSESIIGTFSDADLIDVDSRPLSFRLWETLAFDSEEQDLFAGGSAFRVLIRHPVVTGATLAFRKEYFDLVTPIPEDEIHDRWISYLLAMHGSFAVISEPLIQYRRHPQQQVGPGPMTLATKIEVARSRGKQFYLEEIKRFRKLHDRLIERKSDFNNAEYALHEIEKKLSHLEHRAYLPHIKVARVPRLLRETFNGNYWHCSGGWRSLAKDLMVR
jgi:glycosyltransferase involved in cell wall biosynthesis